MGDLDNGEGLMTATMIDLDDEALEKARRYYGTVTKRDTVSQEWVVPAGSGH
jgi:Arc/MetJ family transcription regulator